MIRKTLIILSLIGLLLSVGLWGVSYWRIQYCWNHSRKIIWLGHGAIRYMTKFVRHSHYVPEQQFSVEGFDDFYTDWYPKFEKGWRGRRSVLIPMWIPTAAFASVVGGCLYVPYHRRRKRKKLGLCMSCGYDLRGSADICPECGQAIE